jgi:tetratricopeptide (TPR) repeat protein
MHNGLCLALGEQGRFAESLAAADRALALSARDPNSLSLAHSNRASALRSLGDEDGADAALWDAARAIPPGDADALLGHALTLSTHDEAEAAVEFCARFVVCALATERGDRPALDVLDNAPREVLDRITRAEHLARAIATVRAGRDEPIPDDMQIPARIVLEPDAWDRFAALAGI